MFLLNLLLALAWLFLTGEFSPLNFFFGFVISFLTLWLVEEAIEGNVNYIRRALMLPPFIVFFLVQLTKANLRVTYDVLTRRHYMKPGIIAIPLEAKTNIEIALLANLLTLTPGTLSLDVSEDASVLYVHAMYVEDPDAFRNEIKEQLEKRLLRILR